VTTEARPISFHRARVLNSTQLAFGLAIVLIFWPLSWSRLHPWSDWAFFPLWLGYIVTADGILFARRGTSLLRSGWPKVGRLFASSAVVWWSFEAFNLRVANWQYLQVAPVSTAQFILQATLDFSTVLPAIFVTTMVLETFVPMKRSTQSSRIGNKALFGWIAVGLVTLTLPLVWPAIFYPLIWGCLFFIFDPINARAGRPSLLISARQKLWHPIVLLGTAGLICGFFWEMWNSLSLPKWIYSIPGIPQQRLFEMPLLGYLGYMPFAFECFAIYTFVLMVVGDSRGKELPLFGS
jgi:hypothetical protein